MNIGTNPYGQFLQNTQPNFNNYGQNNYGQSNPYQQNVYQQNQQIYPQQSLIKVNGLESARRYTAMGANSQVALFDATTDHMYIRCTDGANTETTYEYVLVPYDSKKESVNQDFVSRAEFDDFKAQITSMAQSMQQADKVPTNANKTRTSAKKVEE